jgi:hypothetical protein
MLANQPVKTPDFNDLFGECNASAIACDMFFD